MSTVPVRLAQWPAPTVPLPAVRAEELGLVNHLTQPGETLNHAVELATRIARNAYLAVAAFERAVTERTAFGDQEAFRQQDRIVAPVLTSEDAREGARAFAEKRTPHWQGRRDRAAVVWRLVDTFLAF